MTRLHRAFTLIELLVVIGIIAVLLAILLPALEKAREHAHVAKCATNLRSLGAGLALYANENHGNYARTVYQPGLPPTAGTNASAPNPFAAGGPAPNDVSAAIFLLVRTQRFPTVMFTCPYNDVNDWQPDPAQDPPSRSNFTDYRHNLGYSYLNPYPIAPVQAAGYLPGQRLDPAMPVMADINPGSGSTENSENHEERGQNVLYADGHVQWEISPLVGIDKDNIYVNKAGMVNASPVDPSDAVLLPAQK